MAAEIAVPLITAGLSTGASVGGTIFNNKFNREQAAEQRDWSERMVNQQNAWNMEMWDKTNEYNSPAAQVQRLRDAGLNPLYYGLDGSSANGLESAQPLGYDRASMNGVDNPVAAGLGAYTQLKSLQKDIELKNAEIDKMKSETSGIELDNEFKEKTMSARAESENLKNDIDRATIKKINAERDKISADIKKVAAETDSEIAKKMLYEAETNLHDMEAREIAALLPYKQLLTEAQTEAQKASAAANFAKAAIDNALFEAGYVDNIIDQQCAEYTKTINESERAEFEAAITEFKSNIRNGKAIDLSRYEGKPIGKALAKFMNAFYQNTAMVGEAIGGIQGLAGVAVGAALKGNKTVVNNTSSTHGKSTILYDADGNPSVTKTW